MSLKNTVEAILDNQLNGSPYFVVDVLVSLSKIRKKITVLVDSDEGISIDECGAISSELGTRLEEVIDDAFTLEVSSPGVDTPLKFARQYQRNIGRKLRIFLTDGREIKGELQTADSERILVQPDKIKKVVPEPVSIRLEEIKEAKVLVTFK